MNAKKVRCGLISVVVASLAAGVALAGKAESADGERVEKRERQEHITRQGVHRQQQHVNNAPRQDSPRVEAPRRSPPAAVPRPPQGSPPQGRHEDRGGNDNRGGNDHRGGNDNRGSDNHNGGHNNGNHHGNHDKGGYYAGGRNPHFVPPPRYNNGHSNGHYNGHSHRHVRSPRYVTTLPHGYHRHYWNGSPYYYHGGSWYRPYGSSYIVATAPYGLFVPYLSSFSSLWFGNTRYYHSGGVYYNYEPVRRGYVVTRSPYVEDSDDAEDLYFYPAQGQGEQQQTDDRYECHRWSVDQSGYDPVDSNYNEQRREDYDRALTACMTGRGYTVS